jgi:PQQ-dependent dehydrogenase (methanol/ethanol family)
MEIRSFSQITTLLLSVLVVTLFSNCKNEAPKTAATATAASAAPKSAWSFYGGDQKNQRYSTLDQINTANAKDLKLAWEQSLNHDEAQECTPIIAEGTIFVTTASGPKYVHAFDAKTGTPKWRIEFQIAPDIARFACCGIVNRGASYSNGKLFVGRLDGKLTCLNAADGKELWTTEVVDYKQGSVITSPPLIVGDKVVTGHGGGEYGSTSYISAYDMNTGKIAWKTLTVPGTDPKVAASWKGDSWKTGGAAPWFIGSYDADLNTIYWGTSNPSPWNATMRGVDNEKYGEKTNLYSASTLALNPADGTIKWHYQTTPFDAWDYDGVNESVLADLDIAGVKTPVLMHADRNGFFYCINRTNGKVVSADAFVKVNWAKSIDVATGLPVEDPAFRLTAKNSVKAVFPSFMGGKNWQPMAFNPGTGLVYIPANNVGMDFKAAKVNYQRGYFFLGSEWAMQYDKDVTAGEYIAWDPINKKKVWSIPQKFPIPGGAMTTAGNLMFYGNLEGTFNAVDAKTGASVWTTKTTSGVCAAPMTYEVDGKQYVAIVEGRPTVIPGFLGGKMGEDMVKATPAGGKISVFALK